MAESQSANRAKTEFLSRVSHELRTPLNAILGFAQILESDSREPESRRALAQIIGAGRHLLSLINELIDVSRIESGHLPMSVEPVPLRPVLEEVLALSDAIARQRDVHLELEPMAPDLTASADRQRLLQVLLNLVSNGIKFNRPGGHVWIAAAQHSGTVEISVTDDGPGIPEDLRTRLFQPFERLGAESRGAAGTGLGLAIARQLARAMDGDIGIAGGNAGGCRFTVTLRAAPPGPATAPTPASPVPPSTSEPEAPSPPEPRIRKLVAIEDNASNQALIEALMTRRELWRLHQASTVAEGRRLILELKPDLVLLDLHLPDHHGDTLLNELRELPEWSSTRIAFLTADASQQVRQRLLDAGAMAVLTKPINIQEFYALLDQPS